MLNDTPPHFCMHQRNEYNPTTKLEFICTYTEKHNSIGYWCPFKTQHHAEFICHWYAKAPCKKLSTDERLDNLETRVDRLAWIIDKMTNKE